MDNFDEMETLLAGKIGRSSKCPPPEMLLAYRQNVLRDEAESAIETHLRNCRICPILLEDLVSISQQNLTSDEDRRIRSRVPAACAENHCATMAALRRSHRRMFGAFRRNNSLPAALFVW